MKKPFVYFDRNGGDFSWFLREPDGIESTHPSLGLATAEALKTYQGVDIFTKNQSAERTP